MLAQRCANPLLLSRRALPQPPPTCAHSRHTHLHALGLEENAHRAGQLTRRIPSRVPHGAQPAATVHRRLHRTFAVGPPGAPAHQTLVPPPAAITCDKPGELAKVMPLTCTVNGPDCSNFGRHLPAPHQAPGQRRCNRGAASEVLNWHSILSAGPLGTCR